MFRRGATGTFALKANHHVEIKDDFASPTLRRQMGGKKGAAQGIPRPLRKDASCAEEHVALASKIGRRFWEETAVLSTTVSIPTRIAELNVD